MMSLEEQLLAALYMMLAALLSAIIGMNRERTEHSAGLRTHMLVGVGSCLFTVLSIYAFPVGDTGRVAAQVVSGIGFLGAGVILQGRHGVKNLTTAASIWATAALGMAVGVGAWFLAIATTVLIWTILAVLFRLKKAVVVENDD